MEQTLSTEEEWIPGSQPQHDSIEEAGDDTIMVSLSLETDQTVRIAKKVFKHIEELFESDDNDNRVPNLHCTF